MGYPCRALASRGGFSRMASCSKITQKIQPISAALPVHHERFPVHRCTSLQSNLAEISILELAELRRFPDHCPLFPVPCESASGDNSKTQKNRPPSLTGAKLPWFSRVARALLAANGGVAVGAEGSLRGVATQHYCCSAPVEDAIPWGDVVPWAAKLFSINLICTVRGTRSW